MEHGGSAPAVDRPKLDGAVRTSGGKVLIIRTVSNSIDEATMRSVERADLFAAIGIALYRGQMMPNLFADGRAARFAQEDNLVAELRDLLGQAFDLRGFAAPFSPLERDEQPHTPFYELTESGLAVSEE